MIWPLCRPYSITNNVSKVNEDDPVGGVGAGTGAKGVGAEAGNCGKCGVTMFSGSVIYDLDVYFNLDFGSMFNLDLIPKFGS